jgi:hypothetical protein
MQMATKYLRQFGKSIIRFATSPAAKYQILVKYSSTTIPLVFNLLALAKWYVVLHQWRYNHLASDLVPIIQASTTSPASNLSHLSLIVDIDPSSFKRFSQYAISSIHRPIPIFSK